MYLFFYGLMSLVYGLLLDVFGCRWVIIGGLVLFIVVLVGCVLLCDMFMLLVFCVL